MFKRFHILAVLGSLALSGCGTSSLLISDATSKPTGYMVTLNVTDGSTQATLEQRYIGTALAFDAQSGFAMLHTSKAPAKNDPAVKSVQANSESLAPDIKKEAANEVDLNGNTSSATGSTSWSNGWTTWGSGSSAWGSGSTSWGSGSTSWGSGTVVPALPVENQSTWNQINLYEAHRLSRNFGGGIKVAVIDSGIDLNHPIFAGKLSNAAEFWDYVGKMPARRTKQEATFTDTAPPLPESSCKSPLEPPSCRSGFCEAMEPQTPQMWSPPSPVPSTTART
jgi:thermitase